MWLRMYIDNDGQYTPCMNMFIGLARHTDIIGYAVGSLSAVELDEQDLVGLVEYLNGKIW